MPRLRALLSFMLAAAWCAAIWHADLEAIGLMFKHEHHAQDGEHAHGAHGGHDTDHEPIGAHDDHEAVYAQNLVKDQIRAVAGLWVTVVGLALWLAATLRPSLAALTSARQRRETDPPLAHVWQFVQRCAPESAAPPSSR